MDDALAVERLRALVRVPTVSRDDRALRDDAAFEAFPRVLAEQYPRVVAALERIETPGTSLLFRWRGREAGDPVVLMAHWDVVPADEPGWRHPPFAAAVTDETDGRMLWGRGAIDDKGALAAILEAVDDALAAGVVPRRDVILAFGGDEEVHGRDAARAAQLLAERGVRAAFVLDEGGAVVSGQFPGVAAPTAVIGVAEKGIATLELVAREPGGHAAHPPRSGATATSRLARAILRTTKPVPARMPPTAAPMFAALAPHARGLAGFAYRHPRLLRRVLLARLARGTDESNALIRTTRVVSRLRGAAADNVLPETAVATVNLRVAVGSTLEAEVERLRRDLAGTGVEVRVVQGSDPSPVSPAEGAAWETLTAALRASHPDAVPVPYAMLGATDGRHFTRLGPVYRFTPFELTKAELGGLHAIDERIPVAAYVRGIRFYRALLDLV